MSTREETQSLAQEVIASLRKTTQDQLRELYSAHQTMAREVKADLAKGYSDLTVSVVSQLNDLANAHQQMARELRADLAKRCSDLDEAEGQRKKEAEQEVGQRKSDVAQRKSDVAQHKGDVAAQLKEYRDKQARARAVWQELTTTGPAKRGGGTALAEAPEPAPIEKATGVPGPGATEEMAPQILDLGGRVFDYLANCPGGVKLAKMEQEFGLSRIKMARAVRTLMDEGRVEKRDLLYFTV